MAHYLLGTDICSYIMKRSHPVLLERIRSVPIADQAMSAVTAAELLYGVKLSPKQKQAREAFNAFVRHLDVLEWPAEAAEHYVRRASPPTTPSPCAWTCRRWRSWLWMRDTALAPKLRR